MCSMPATEPPDVKLPVGPVLVPPGVEALKTLRCQLTCETLTTVDCFTNDTDWGVYEGIQADLFDHIFAIVREFDLRIFQDPSGGDLARLRDEKGREEKVGEKKGAEGSHA